MTSDVVYGSLKIVGYVVLLTMIGSVVFAGYIVTLHWTGIGV